MSTAEEEAEKPVEETTEKEGSDEEEKKRWSPGSVCGCIFLHDGVVRCLFYLLLSQFPLTRTFTVLEAILEWPFTHRR